MAQLTDNIHLYSKKDSMDPRDKLDNPKNVHHMHQKEQVANLCAFVQEESEKRSRPFGTPGRSRGHSSALIGYGFIDALESKDNLPECSLNRFQIISGACSLSLPIKHS